MGWIKIFGTGHRKDAGGGSRFFSQEDMERIVSSYNPNQHEAPVTIPPIKDTSPAWGWVAGLKHIGGYLYAKLKQVQPEFQAMLRAGKYPKQSISLHKDGSLRSVIFSGAPAPCLPGISSYTECDPGSLAFEFSETGGEKNNHFQSEANYCLEAEGYLDFTELELRVMETAELVMKV